MLTALMVANRGEIVSRVFRTARAMGLRCIAVYVDADADAPFVREADLAVHLPDGGYLSIEHLVEAATSSQADSVHPGYGFLSENATFARAILDAGLAWVGPRPEALEAMGDKVAAKRAARALDIPVLPTAAPTPAAAHELGYPVMVKAVAGGGGKGMRVVATEKGLEEAVAAAQREAAAAFGDDRVFLERYVAQARHIEIQVLADNHGNVVHLGERECSIQRRHQKIVEESPSPAISPARRAEMGAAAISMVKSLGYASAGTVEFLLDGETGEYFFLEVNARLQVEHPVTEAVTGIDLVRQQLLVASGAPLTFGQDDVTFSGHAIEARLYAEDPATGFLPDTGRLAAFEPPDEPRVRWDSGVEAGSVVGVDFDPMLAKVIAHGPTRAEAAGRLALALERLHVGGVVTNRDFLAALLGDPAFLDGSDITTDFVHRVQPRTGVGLGGEGRQWVAAAAALWLQGRHRATAPVLAGLPSGWRNARLPAERVAMLLPGSSEPVEVRYRAQRDGSFLVEGVGVARVHRWSERGIDIQIDNHRTWMRVTADDPRLHVQVPGTTVTVEVLPRFTPPGGATAAHGALRAPMPGRVLEVRVAAGERVEAGDRLVVLEAMKMEHHLDATVDGVVTEVHVTAGQQVENGTVLLVLDPDEPGDR